ncbi:MAG TPA: R3H domain-containing nucleic acid-binding protein [Solirubrobacteraceae bacterium]|jgi:spoIIIJ-associated protein
MSEDSVSEEALADEHAEEIDPSDPLELLGELLEEIVDALGLDVDVEVEEADGVITGAIAGEDLGLFIGRRGQTIDAVQHLAQRIVFRGGPVKARVVIDADGYRERRAKQLREDADDAADEVLRLGSPVELDPMPAFERRVVHEHLRERGDVQTHSEGDEPERHLVVSPLEA